MWEISITQEHHCELTGIINGVTVSTDNGDTQYLTIDEYNQMVKNRKELWKDQQ